MGRRITTAALAVAAMVAASPATPASASFDNLSWKTATTSSGGSCRIGVYGGSDARHQTVFSKIDYALSIECPSADTQYHQGWTWITPTSATAPAETFMEPYLDGGPATCSSFSSGNPSFCHAERTYLWGIPGNRYEIRSSAEIHLHWGKTFTSMPPGCNKSHDGRIMYCDAGPYEVVGF